MQEGKESHDCRSETLYKNNDLRTKPLAQCLQSEVAFVVSTPHKSLSALDRSGGREASCHLNFYWRVGACVRISSRRDAVRIAQGKSAMRMQPWISRRRKFPRRRCGMRSSFHCESLPHSSFRPDGADTSLEWLTQGCIRIADLPLGYSHSVPPGRNADTGTHSPVEK